MGQYLACGIATEIRVEKDWKSKTNEKILEEMGKKINLDLYDIYTDDKNSMSKYKKRFI